MNTIQIKKYVDRLFKADLKHRRGQVCETPIVGSGYVPGEEDKSEISRRKKRACAALAAREWFAKNGPADAQPLPIPYHVGYPIGLYEYLIRKYSCSLSCRDYDVNVHPPFTEYVAGVLWEMEHERFCARLNYPGEFPVLKKRFPPRMLAGMGPGLVWEPPALHAKTMEDYRRSRARKAA